MPFLNIRSSKIADLAQRTLFLYNTQNELHCHQNSYFCIVFMTESILYAFY